MKAVEEMKSTYLLDRKE